MTQRIVINTCHGGFGLSKKACDFLGIPWDGYGNVADLKRDDPRLVAAVEALGDEASGNLAQLKIVEIPDGVVWQIDEYDGLEWVAETHRRWWHD